MNKKQFGSALRRGVVTGTLAGFVAGWVSFAGHSKQLDAAEVGAAQDVRQRQADALLPPVPALPKLGPLPTTGAYRISLGPDVPAAPRAAPAAAPVAAPGPVATFAPLPALPAAAKPVTKTRTSGKP